MPTDNFDTQKQTFNLQIKKLLEDNAVEFAGEANTIVINNDIKDS